VAPGKLRDRRHVVAIFVAFNDNIKLALQSNILDLF
jgi:hypothetical protein